MRAIQERVEQFVSPVYIVGGAVRDHIRGARPKDYDFATPLLPDDIEHQIRDAGRRPYRAGKRFGTLGFRLDGEVVEVTTFRNESYESGSRKPDVEFVSDITADLSRRDFTINALAYRSGNIIDPHGGRDDLRAGVIRAVGCATRRFKEDPLRMLRAARFAAQLGFDIEEQTADRSRRLCHRILTVSRERWVMEMDKLLTAPHVDRGLDALVTLGLLRFMFPSLSLQVGYDQNSCHHSLPLWEHTKRVVSGVCPVPELRWAALLHDIGKPYVRQEKPGRSIYVKHDLIGAEMVESIASQLRWSNTRREMVTGLVLNHLRDDSPLKAADDAAKGAV